MTIKDFEEGRKLQRLETQIQTIYTEISLGSGKNNPSQQASLRELLEGAFSSYINLALQYKVPSDEVQRVSEFYQKALGKDKA